jgi:tetratricopeptide (TPR) repeat protein
VRAVGGHWERARAYEDWCLTSELAKRWPLAFIDVPLLLYRVHPEQLTGRPRLNIECYRDVILHAWRGDPDAYAKHKEIIDLSLGTAYSQLGELEAEQGNWRAAEDAFRRALISWPRLKRAYPNLALATLRSRVPLFAESRFSKILPSYLRAGS